MCFCLCMLFTHTLVYVFPAALCVCVNFLLDVLFELHFYALNGCVCTQPCVRLNVYVFVAISLVRSVSPFFFFFSPSGLVLTCRLITSECIFFLQTKLCFFTHNLCLYACLIRYAFLCLYMHTFGCVRISLLFFLAFSLCLNMCSICS